MTQTTIIYKQPHLYCSHPCVTRLTDGEWLVAFSSSRQHTPYLHPPEDPHYYNLICRSSDGGQHWEAPRVVPNYESKPKRSWCASQCPL